MIRDEASGLLVVIKQLRSMNHWPTKWSPIFKFDRHYRHKILNHINPISKFLPSKDFNLIGANDLLNSSLTFFKELRSDESFDNVILKAEKLEDLEVTEINVRENIKLTAPCHRARSKKRNFSYESIDEPMQDLKEKCEIDFFPPLYYKLGDQYTGAKIQSTDSVEFLYDVHKPAMYKNTSTL